MKIGYDRVSTDEQRLDLQIQALERSGCDIIFNDHGISGKTYDRDGLNMALSRLQSGDQLVVWRLDRLGRSISHLVKLMEGLGERDVSFRSLTENIDTSSSGGRLVFHMMAALAEFERSLISERTRAGMEAARRNGKHVGRRPSLTPDQLERAIVAVELLHEPLDDVASRFDVSERSLKRLIRLRHAQHRPSIAVSHPASPCGKATSRS